MHVAVVAVAASLAALYLVLRQLLQLAQSPREPPVLATTVPFLSPIIGVLRQKHDFLASLRDRFRYPIYTLHIPGLRYYIINTPQLISSVQKNFRVLTFQAVTDKFSFKICDTSKTAQDAQLRVFEEWQNAANSAPSPSHKSYQTLAPGEALDEMNRVMVGRLGREIEEIAVGGEKELRLFDWVKGVVTIATTDGVYGQKNPYRDINFQNAHWKFNDGLSTFATGIFPNFFAPESVAARTHNAKGFEHYYKSGDYLQGSTFTQHRYDWHVQAGFPLADIAKLEVGNGIAILANTTPTAFWAVYHIFSSPPTLSALRTEISAHVVITKDGSQHLDISKLKNDSPLLLSAYKETMRLRSTTIGMRKVMSDILLDGTHLLKKDAMVFMPAYVQHSDPSLWGPDVASFNHERFIPDPSRKRPKTNPVSFRAFGGGTTLCPGRHFATTEVLVLVAMLVLRFNVEPVGGKWKDLTTNKAPMTAAMPEPDEDVDVRIRQKPEDVGVKWTFSLSASEKGLVIAAEDIEGAES